MRKILTKLVVVIVMCVMVCAIGGCGKKTEKAVSGEQNIVSKTKEDTKEDTRYDTMKNIKERFVYLGSVSLDGFEVLNIYYDTQTLIVYQYTNDDRSVGGASPLLSDDGINPAHYNPETGEIK